MKKLLLLFVVFLLPMVVSADDSGKCGDNVTYTFVEATKTLTISGTGAMFDLTNHGASWYSYRDKIEIVIIEEGVTSIGNYAFADCSSLTSITIPKSVIEIHFLWNGLFRPAFSNCSSLRSIVVDPDNKTYDSRDGCNAVIKTSENTLIFGCKNTVIPNSVTSIGTGAFLGCSGLTSITIPNSVTSIEGSAFSYCI